MTVQDSESAFATSYGRWATLKHEIDMGRVELHTAKVRPNPQMCQFLILGEDHRIGLHPSVDLIALCRATLHAWSLTAAQAKSSVREV